MKQMEADKHVTGVLLAGGRSSRFGSNKALALWRGKFLIQHVREALYSVFTDCLLVTNSPEEYVFLNMPMISDRYQNMGPLAGIHAALHHSSKPWIFVVGCDMPAVTPEIITFLCGLAKEEYEAVIPWPKTGAEPLCGLYHKTALAKIEKQLGGKKGQITKLLHKLYLRKVKEAEFQIITDGSKVFSNVNLGQDLDNLA